MALQSINHDVPAATGNDQSADHDVPAAIGNGDAPSLPIARAPPTSADLAAVAAGDNAALLFDGAPLTSGDSLGVMMLYFYVRYGGLLTAVVTLIAFLIPVFQGRYWFSVKITHIIVAFVRFIMLLLAAIVADVRVYNSSVPTVCNLVGVIGATGIVWAYAFHTITAVISAIHFVLVISSKSDNVLAGVIGAVAAVATIICTGKLTIENQFCMWCVPGESHVIEAYVQSRWDYIVGRIKFRRCNSCLPGVGGGQPP